MFYRPGTRLFLVKFIGLFGSSHKADGKINSDAESDAEAEIHSRHLSKSLNVHQDHAKGIASCSQRVASFMIEKGIPGLTICVARRGHIVWHSGFGLCDIENQLECKAEARMRIASISKSIFAATVIAPMIEQNKIDLNSSIYEYLSPEEFPRKKFDGKDVDITVGQLMSHTSGIRHYDEGKASDLPFRPIGSPGSLEICQCDDQYHRRGFFQRTTYRSVMDAVEPFRNEPLASEPGKFKYTSYGYTLLSAVAERALQQAATDDKTKKEQIEDHWIKEMRRGWGLEETNLDQDELLLPNRARYYLRTAYNGGLINAPYTDNSVKWAGGGVNSSTKDLIKFGNILIDSYKERKTGKLKRQTLDLLWTERQESYGLGFEIKKLDPSESGGETRAIFHLGCALGASSALIIYPESEIVVAILANLGSINLKAMALSVANEFAH